jgi:hypothetical protein
VDPLVNENVTLLAERLNPVVAATAETVSVNGTLTVFIPVPLNRMFAV